MSTSTPAAAEPSLPSADVAANRRRSLFSTSVISFSLTFVGVGVAVLAGYLPAQQALLTGKIDAEVVLLFVPLAALVFAIVAEAIRIAAKGPLLPRGGRRTKALSDWTPGHGEG